MVQIFPFTAFSLDLASMDNLYHNKRKLASTFFILRYEKSTFYD